MNRCVFALALLVSASASAQVTEPPLAEVPPVERYSPMDAAHRPLTVPDRLLTFGLALGPFYAINPLGTDFQPYGAGDIYLRYGITDRLEWGIPLFLAYRLGDLEARDGFEFAVFGGLDGLGFNSNVGFTFLPAAGVKLRRLLGERSAFVGMVRTQVAVGASPVSLSGQVPVGVVFNLSDRLSLDLSVTPSAAWFVGPNGRRRLQWSVGFGGMQRPVLRWHLLPRVELLATVGARVGRTEGVNLPMTNSVFTAGLGAELRL